jgi:diguanylate cyclase (GGDEF)-like protein/PAS domain S-box-containing protein
MQVTKFDTGVIRSELNDIHIFSRIWIAAQKSPDELPPFEEVALGSLGQAAQRTALFGGGEDGRWKAMRVGRSIAAWLNMKNGDHLEDSCDIAGETVLACLRDAVERRRPVLATLPVVTDDLVETLEVLALPLSTRWSMSLALLFAQARPHRMNIANVLLSVSEEGFLAFAPLRLEGGSLLDFQVVSANPAAGALLGRQCHDLKGQRATNLLRAFAQGPLVLEKLRASMNLSRPTRLEVRLERSDEFIDLQIGIAPSGDILAVTLTDVRDIKAREASFRLLFESNPLPLLIFDPDVLTIEQANQSAARIYTIGSESLVGLPLTSVWPEATPDLVRELISGASNEKPFAHYNLQDRRIDAFVYARDLSTKDKNACLLAIVDVTARLQAEAHISFLAQHDTLTGLHNRFTFRKSLEAELARKTANGMLAVICLDLDHFKDVNDTLGHPVGDKLLREVAGRLKDCMREGDVVARLGGDEFAILPLTIASRDDVETVCARLVRTIEEPYFLDDHEIALGVSVGVALAPQNSNDPDTLMKYSDMALYQAKSDGRGAYRFFESAMERKLHARRSLEQDLRHAIGEEELRLHFQPLLRIRDKRLTGFEALVRWARPGHGLVRPMDFIPLAEATGLIVPIGDWILRVACHEAARWPNDLSVSVNVSPAQFRTKRLVPSVIRALAASGLSPSRLELEITETVLLSVADTNVQILHELRSLGVRIAMDDFGTGYSSLSYLRKFPFDKIKIDRSFISELPNNVECLAIVRAVLGLGKSLGVTTTAEGVETQEQLSVLQAEGCTEAQGYLLSKPIAAEDLPALLCALDSRVRAA